MKALYLLILLIVCGCQDSDKSNVSKNSANVVRFDEELVIAKDDSLILQTSRHKYPLSEFSDSSNSFCQLSGDTLKFYLRSGLGEGSYALDINIIKETSKISFRLIDNHNKYIYFPSLVQIILNKNKFKANDYVIAYINYSAIGKFQDSRDDTAVFKGKIRLKIRDSKFNFRDFAIETNRNDFYALLMQRPDTITKLNLYGCAFTDLPKELTLFTTLEELDLSRNELSNSDLSLLKNLKTIKSLNLTECNLSSFPLAVLYLPNLETLSIWNNKISSIPDGLYDMTSLKKLTIGNNNICYLSPKISRLINLELFESSSTDIRVYPNEMVRLKKLTEIFPGDTMQYIPKALIKYVWGCDTILTKESD